MAAQYLFAGLAVARLDAALAWYERLWGRPPDRIPNETEAVWQVTETGLLYVVADPSRAGRGLLTVMVDDLDEHLAAVTARGIATAPVETAPGLFRKTVIEDPEGNRIQLGEAVSAALV